MRKIIIIIIALIVIGGGAFYGGMKCGQSKIPSRQAFQSSEQRQQFSQERAGKGIGAGLINGEVIAKDEQSLTLKMQDGSSKIIFYSDSTEISKLVSGAQSDLEVGKTVTINGKTNQDGSITAQSIQLRPVIAP